MKRKRKSVNKTVLAVSLGMIFVCGFGAGFMAGSRLQAKTITASASLTSARGIASVSTDQKPDLRFTAISGNKFTVPAR